MYPNADSRRKSAGYAALLLLLPLIFVLGLVLHSVSSSPQHHVAVPRKDAQYNGYMMNRVEGAPCISNHCTDQYGELVPAAGSQACSTYQEKRTCITWKAWPCSEPKGVICPPGQVYPSPSTLKLANGQTVYEMSWSWPSYYLVGTSGPLRTLHAIDAYGNHGVEACTPGSYAWQQANQYTPLPIGTKVQFC